MISYMLVVKMINFIEVDYHNGEVINDLKLDIVAQDDLVKRFERAV